MSLQLNVLRRIMPCVCTLALLLIVTHSREAANAQTAQCATLGRTKVCSGAARLQKIRARVQQDNARSESLEQVNLVPARKGVAESRTFYVDSVDGNDSNSGLAPTQAWRSIQRVNQGYYNAGDAILFHGWQQFTGTLSFSLSNSSSTAAAPITIGSYARGRAAILGGTGSGLVAENVGGFNIARLKFVGTSSSCQSGSYGILFHAHDLNRTLSHIFIDRVKVRGFCNGLTIGAGDDTSKFDDIRITHAIVRDNADGGISTYDPANGAHDLSNVYVGYSRAFNNADTGGIFLFGVNGGTIEHSVAYNNGFNGYGTVGIWAFDADRITIQYNEAFNNKSLGDDGDGFDLDGGVSNSAMQYNYSHDNSGIGFLVCGCVDYYSMSDNIVRYNVSENDGSSGQPSALYVLGGEPFSGLEIYNNTFYSQVGAGALVDIDAGSKPMPHVHLRNNLLLTAAGKTLLMIEDPQHATDLLFQGNDYWAYDSAFKIAWDTSSYSDLNAWRDATGQEQLNGSATGFNANPQLCNVGHGGAMYPQPLANLHAYKLQSTSRLINAGLDLHSTFGIEVGSHDFYNNPAPAGGAYDLGANEFQSEQSCT